MPDAEYAHPAPHLGSVPMLPDDKPYGSGDRLRYACFPCTSVISPHDAIEEDASSEIDGVGSDMHGRHTHIRGRPWLSANAMKLHSS